MIRSLVTTRAQKQRLASVTRVTHSFRPRNFVSVIFPIFRGERQLVAVLKRLLPKRGSRLFLRLVAANGFLVARNGPHECEEDLRLVQYFGPLGITSLNASTAKTTVVDCCDALES